MKQAYLSESLPAQFAILVSLFSFSSLDSSHFLSVFPFFFLLLLLFLHFFLYLCFSSLFFPTHCLSSCSILTISGTGSIVFESQSKAFSLIAFKIITRISRKVAFIMNRRYDVTQLLHCPRIRTHHMVYPNKQFTPLIIKKLQKTICDGKMKPGNT